MLKAALLELLQVRLPALAAALAPDADVVADDAANGEPSLDLGDQVDLTFGLRGEVEGIADAAGEAIGLGPVSAMTLDAGSARMSALQVQKQLAMEAVSIVNAAPQALVNLIS